MKFIEIRNEVKNDFWPPRNLCATATQASSVNSEKRLNSTERPTERKQELICRVRYGNTLPDIPFDLKFLHYPFDNQRFVKYNPTSLERNYKYDVLMEHDLGVTIDLINRDLYQADPYAQLDPADERILEEDVHAPQDSIRSRQHSRSVSWLRKSEYISTEQTRFQPQNLENIEAKVGYNVKKSLRGETLYLDREAQIKAIEKTFVDSKQEITKHFSKPNVVPVEVLHIYPDYENWKYPCAQVIFDSDPAPVGKNVPAQIEEMSQAMIRGVMDESGEQFVAYFLPTEKTLEKRRLDVADKVLYKDGEDYEYRIAREYNWNVKSKASKGYEENYFFVLTSDGVYYNELETRVRLNKRRVKVGQQTNNTKLIIKHRPLDVHEHRMQRNREKQLEPACDDDEEEIDVNDTERIVNSESNKLGNKDEMTDNAIAAQNQNERDSILRSRSNSLNLSPRRSVQSGSDLPASSHSRSRSRSAHSHTSSGTRSTSQSSNGGSNDSRTSHKSSSRSGSKVDKESGSANDENGRSPSLSPNNSTHSSGADSRANSQSKSPRRSVSRSSSDSSEGSASELENDVA